jgi:hypothetical protein
MTTINGVRRAKSKGLSKEEIDERIKMANMVLIGMIAPMVVLIVCGILFLIYLYLNGFK